MPYICMYVCAVLFFFSLASMLNFIIQQNFHNDGQHFQINAKQIKRKKKEREESLNLFIQYGNRVFFILHTQRLL